MSPIAVNVGFSMSSMRSCPFCGQYDCECKVYVLDNPTKHIYWIHCNKCRADGPVTKTEKKAWKKWNKRSCIVAEAEVTKSLDQSIDNWINANLRKPCDNHLVIVAVKDGCSRWVSTGQYCSDAGMWWSVDEKRTEVTHWQAYPKLPVIE